MLLTRIIPTLLLYNDSLVKTINFKKIRYIGDPCNTVRIFNELEVDELIFLDIRATREKKSPNFRVLSEIATECFMPLVYGGGVKSLDHAKKIFDIGFEKIAINSSATTNQKLITEIASVYGSQAVIGSIDVKRTLFGKYRVFSSSGQIKTVLDPVDWAKDLESLGAGELLLTSIDKEGTWAGFDLQLVNNIADSVNIPVIAHGGAGNIDHIVEVIKKSNASAVALGSLVVYQKKDMGVLINMPKAELLKNAIS